jgi:hypothetical protein
VALGVEAEAVVAGRQEVLRADRGALVIDVEPPVVAEVGRRIREVAQAEHVAVGPMGDAVDEVEVPQLATLDHRLVERRGVRKAPVLEPHVGLRGHELEGDPREDSERAVAAVEHAEEQRLALRRAGDDLSGAADHLVLEAAVVEASMAEGRRFDRAACDGPADGDSLELGDDRRQQPQGERRFHEARERHSWLGDADAPRRVDEEDLVEGRDVDRLPSEARVARQRDDVLDPPSGDEDRLHAAGPLANRARDRFHLRAVLLLGARHEPSSAKASPRSSECRPKGQAFARAPGLRR